MKRILVLSGFIMLLIACSSNGGDGNENAGYDRKAMLGNWADNIIIPAYENYQAKVQTLTTDATAFTTAPTSATLQTLRTSWLEAYKAYQFVGMYDLGKAADINLKTSANTYPADAAGINANITGTYDLTLYAQFDKQGFPGLDYLINGLAADDVTIVGFYSSNANAAAYKLYLTKVVARLQTTIDAVVSDWNNGYRDTYVNNDGTSVSSSVNKTTNLFVKNFERDIRSAKVGIPAGTLSGGTTYPEKVEAYYKNNVSKELLNLSLTATQDFFNGKYFGSAATGESLKSYLDYVDAVRDNQNLSDIINNQYATIFSANEGLNNSFSQQVFSDNSKMLASYDAIQQNLVYLKLDMMQALSITIDYVDGDGD